MQDPQITSAIWFSSDWYERSMELISGAIEILQRPGEVSLPINKVSSNCFYVIHQFSFQCIDLYKLYIHIVFISTSTTSTGCSYNTVAILIFCIYLKCLDYLCSGRLATFGIESGVFYCNHA